MPAPSPTFERTRRIIDDRRTEALAELCALARIASVSATPSPEMERCAEALAESMARSGLRTSLVPTAGNPVVFGERKVSPDLPSVLIYGHYDVQPAGPINEWTTPPFEPTVRDGRLYGRGTSDNKAQHLAQLLAIRALIEAEGELPLNVKFVVEGDEEIGSPHLADFARAHEDLLRANLAYTSDGPIHRSGNHQVMLGARGLVAIRIEVRTATRDAHSGSLGGLLPDAAARLVDLLAGLHDQDGRVAVSGFYDDIQPLTLAERQAIERLPVNLSRHLDDYGISALPGPPDVGYFERLCARPTLTINGLSSGYVGPGIKTVIPATAVAHVDMRLVPHQDPASIFEAFRAHVRRHCPEASLELLAAVPPSRTDVGHPYVSVVADAIAKVTGRPPLLVPSLASTVPDYVFTKVLGIPSLLVPYANSDQNNHAPDENIDLQRFREGALICAAVLTEMAAVGPDLSGRQDQR